MQTFRATLIKRNSCHRMTSCRFFFKFKESFTIYVAVVVVVAVAAIIVLVINADIVVNVVVCCYMLLTLIRPHDKVSELMQND